MHVERDRHQAHGVRDGGPRRHGSAQRAHLGAGLVLGEREGRQRGPPDRPEPAAGAPDGTWPVGRTRTVTTRPRRGGADGSLRRVLVEARLEGNRCTVDGRDRSTCRAGQPRGHPVPVRHRPRGRDGRRPPAHLPGTRSGQHRATGDQVDASAQVGLSFRRTTPSANRRTADHSMVSTLQRLRTTSSAPGIDDRDAQDADREPRTQGCAGDENSPEPRLAQPLHRHERRHDEHERRQGEQEGTDSGLGDPCRRRRTTRCRVRLGGGHGRMVTPDGRPRNAFLRASQRRAAR